MEKDKKINTEIVDMDLVNPFVEASSQIESNSNVTQSNPVLAPEGYDAAVNTGMLQVKSKDEYKNYRIIKVALPSKSKLYPKNSPLYGKEVIEVRNINGTDEDILGNPKLRKAGKNVDELIRNVLITPGINTGEFLNGDKEAIVIALRIDAYGSEYTPDVKYFCEFCQENFVAHFDLSKLELKTPSEKLLSQGGNVFELTLPVSKQKVGVKFLTSREENEYKEYLLHNSTDSDKPRTINRWWHIVHVNGNTDRNYIKQHCLWWEPKDYDVVDEFIEENEPSVVLEQEVMCTECFSYSKQMIPITNNFFRINRKK